MALDSTGLFTVIGKYVKAVNTWNGYITTLETQKDDIFTQLEAEGLQDLYVDLPAQFLGFKTALGSWISSLNGEVEDILLDEDYVTDELPIYQRDVVSVLNAIYDYMVDNAITIKSSVVTLGGSDADTKLFYLSPGSGTAHIGQVFVSRKLDGVSAPSALVSAHTRYTNAESQLAMSCTTQVRCISNTVGSESLQLFCEVDAQAPYGPTAEKPGNGPVITNIEANNIIPANSDFTSFSVDTPNNWTMAGGVQTTDWGKWVGTGPGLEFKTAGVTAKQQLTGLTRYQNYCYAVFLHIGNPDDGLGTKDAEVIVTVETAGGSAYSTSNTAVVNNAHTPVVPVDNYLDNYKVAYGFFCPGETDDLNDFYLKIESDVFDDTDLTVIAERAVVAPVTYYNGLGFAFWSPYAGEIPINATGSIAISNNNGGVFQTYFRRAFGIQLPTADSPTISDTLAT